MKRCRPPPRLKDQQKKFYDPMMESLLNQGQQIRKPHPPPTVACHAAASAIESFGHVQPEHPQGNERSRSSIYEAHSLRQFTTSPSRAPVPGHSFSHYTGAPGLPAPPCRYPSPTPDAAPFEPTHPASLAVALFQAYSHAPEEAEAARIILPPLMRPDGRSSPEKRAAAAAARHKGGGIEMLRPQSRQGQSGEPSDVKGAVRILRDMMTDPLKYVYSTSQPL
uniref:Uncharacterized protein n=1 Tax=Chromera velia CCMP2878 TaxID=1169474 RepID=A0A0K6S835_9ALVE|eukprot:Cvel_23218.t2-p1 / transcript=Cvel_23218.t2 / gene=Cvel_23218 / organism=Chromera_velia_CCMP2878 / gene_product=hypothetical protein / transcript_product=hypothetical protein / location=Cvel_scaffold2368:7841-8923(+) / protein_length=221 / sequence_SO=supercontig / SO=protein_coding / is_pseudo=false